MEIKTCEQYVLAQLETKDKEIENKDKEINSLKGTLQELTKLINSVNVYAKRIRNFCGNDFTFKLMSTRDASPLLDFMANKLNIRIPIADEFDEVK